MSNTRWRPTTPLLTGIAACSLVATFAASALLGGTIVAHGNLNSAAFGGLLTLTVLGIALGFIAWLLGLMRAARGRQWDWLFAVLLLGPVGALIYSLTSDATSREMASPHV